MTKRLILLAILALCGCDQIDAWLHPKPKDLSFALISAPPPKALLGVYAGPERVSVQARKGNCATPDNCLTWQKDAWTPLPVDQAPVLPLLAVTQPAEGAYSDALWRTAGGNGRAVLVNSQAGANNAAAGKFDGLRIGLKDATRKTYITAYGLEGGKLTGTQGDVYIANGTVWLLHSRANGSAVLVDLFAQLDKAQPVICLPGLALDTAGQWAGPPEQALSPDIFLSRRTDTPEKADDAAHKTQVLNTCVSSKAEI